LGEGHGEQEREQNLNPRQCYPQLVEELNELAVYALRFVLAGVGVVLAGVVLAGPWDVS
jgi:hypothetical protein